ncbi:tyrosyl-tRNA synthetase, partial [Cladochytrium tenue]
KFGKSAGNAVWLDAGMLAPLDFYQFFRRTPDVQVRALLGYFTFLPEAAISALMLEHHEHPERHAPQRRLAYEVTELVHGHEEAERCQLKSHILFDTHVVFQEGLSAALVVEAFEGDPRLVRLPAAEVLDRDVVSVALAAGAVPSRSAGRKLLSSGGLYVNGTKVDAGATPNSNRLRISAADLLDGRVLFLRTGKADNTVVEVVGAVGEGETVSATGTDA